MKKDIVILDPKRIFCNKDYSNSSYGTFISPVQSINISATPNTDDSENLEYNAFSDESIHKPRRLSM